MTHRFNVFNKDNEILATLEIGEWRVTSIKFVKTTISSGIRCHAILKKGSKITSTFYVANDPVRKQRNLILDNKDEQVGPRDIERKYHTLHKDFRFSEEMSLSGIYGVITGDEGGSPYHFKFNGDGKLNGEDANRYFAIQHINKISAADFSSLSDLEQFRTEYEAEYSNGKPSDEYIVQRYQKNKPDIFKLSKPSTLPLVRELHSVLEWKKNVILEGVPGVGKSFCINGLKKKLGIGENSPRFKSVTFSPSTGQEEFIGGLFPKAGESPPIFEFNPGPLLELAEAASQSSGEPHVLFIDEINRGNIPKIMGQIMTVIEGSKRFDSKKSIRHLTENMEDNVLRAALFTNGDEVEYLGLPDNLWIIGAMNTSDRSVVQIDSALRRRFAFIRVPTMLTESGLGELKSLLIKEDFWTKEKLDQADNFLEMLVSLNEKLDSTIGPDAVLGHSYLFEVKCCEGDPITTQDGKAEKIQTNSLPRKPAEIGDEFDKKSAFFQAASVVNRMIQWFGANFQSIDINVNIIKQRRTEETKTVADELSIDWRTVNNKLYRTGLAYPTVEKFDESFLEWISNKSNTAELYVRMKNKFPSETQKTKTDEIFGFNSSKGNDVTENSRSSAGPREVECLWLAIRDMYLYSILPQVADTLNANGTQKANLIQEATQIHINYLNERLKSNKITGGLKFSSATSGEWRVE